MHARSNLIKDKIDDILTKRCPCFKLSSGNNNCIEQFSYDEVNKIRLEIVILGAQGSIDARRRDARAGILRNEHLGIRKCTPSLLGRTVCMKAYAMLTGHSYTSMSADNKRIYADCAFQKIGRPQKSLLKSKPDKMPSTQKAQFFLAWLHEWLNYNADSHPTGHEHSWSINYIRKRELYSEYQQRMQAAGTPELVPSMQTIYRVWNYFIESERIYVRMKCRTSTKCRGKPL